MRVCSYDRAGAGFEMPADEVWLPEHRCSLGGRPVRIITTGYHAVVDLTRRRPINLEHLQYDAGG